jgi:hypothetical protein
MPGVITLATPGCGSILNSTSWTQDYTFCTVAACSVTTVATLRCLRTSLSMLRDVQFSYAMDLDVDPTTDSKGALQPSG